MNKYISAISTSSITLPIVVVAAAYIFSLSFWLAAVYACFLFLLGSLVHMPEQVPGGWDNPDGSEVHPLWVMVYLLILIVILFVCGHLYPEIKDVPGFKS